MTVTCEQLCSSFSCHKLCQIIAKRDSLTYLVILISAGSAAISFVLSVTQIKASDGFAEGCTENDVIKLLSPFSVSGTNSDGVECFGHCAWPSMNTNLRFTSLSFFSILMIAMIFAMNKMKYIWLIRISLFITLTLLFTALVQDFSALIAGKTACDNDFIVTQDDDEYEIFRMRCDGKITSIDICSLDPFLEMIFADMFVVIMCGALWHIIGYYKAIRTEVKRLTNNNGVLQQQQQSPQQDVVKDGVTVNDPTGNVESEGVGISTVNNSNVGDSTKNHNPFMKQYEEY